MKISKVSYFNQIKTKNQSPKKSKEEASSSLPVCLDASFYRALSFTSKNFSAPFMIDYKKHKIISSATTNQGDRYSIRIDSDIVDEYLLDENQNVDEKLASKFVSLYKSNAQYLRDKEEERIEFYKSKINPQNGNNVVEFPFGPDFDSIMDFEELENIKDDNEYVEAVLSRMTGKDRDNLAEELIDVSREYIIPNIEEDALDYTIRIFELSKTMIGYDFSELDKKRGLIDLIDVVCYNFGFDPTAEISRATRNEDGKIDYELACNILEIMLAIEDYISPMQIAPELKRFYSKDEGKKPEILEAIIKVGGRTPYFNRRFDDFARLFENYFDQNGFNKEAFESSFVF